MIGTANWTPSGFIGQLFRTLGGYVAPPPGVKSPALWGDAGWLESTFAAAKSVNAEPHHFNFRYRSPEHFVDIFRSLYGPVHKAFLALNDNEGLALEADILALVGRFNTANDGSMQVPGEYLEVLIER